MSAADLPVLSIMIAVPMLAALLCLFARAEMARIVALTATLFNLLLGIWLWISFIPGGAQWQFVESYGLTSALGLEARD